MKKVFTAAFLSICLATTTTSWASYSRGYLPLPAGTSLLCTYYNYVSAGKLYKNGTKKGPSDDYDKSVNVGMVRYIHYMNVGNALYGDGGFTINPQFIVPFADISLNGNYEALSGGKDISATGFGDPVVLSTFWLVNDPKNKLWVGFTPWLTIPLGQYKKNRLANPSGNRWAIKPEMGVVKGIGDMGYLELTLGGEFYTENGEYQGNKKLEQDPTIQAEVHYSYDITKKFGTALDYYYSNGGETKINGVRQNNPLNNHGLGLSLFVMLGSSNQLLVSYRYDFAVKTGTDDKTLGLRWTYLF